MKSDKNVLKQIIFNIYYNTKILITDLQVINMLTYCARYRKAAKHLQPPIKQHENWTHLFSYD